MNPIQVVCELLQQDGVRANGGETVTQLDHALQCALLAEDHCASATLTVAALLHDVGHLLSDALPPHRRGSGDDHAETGARFLAQWFGKAVVQPVRFHIDAKRYLCGVNPGYQERLPPASRRSLQRQGGAFTPAEVAAYLKQPYAQEAILLRLWDDSARRLNQETPDLDHFRPFLESSLAARSANTARAGRDPGPCATTPRRSRRKNPQSPTI